MSNNTIPIPPLVPGSAKFNYLETINLKYDDLIELENLITSGDITADIITDGIATLTSGKISDLIDPVKPQDLATKAYVDSLVQTPKGFNSFVQFNSSGIFNGSDNLTWNSDTSILTVTDDVDKGTVIVESVANSTERGQTNVADFDLFGPNGTFKTNIVAPSGLVSSYMLALPIDNGDNNQVLTTDGGSSTANLSWSDNAVTTGSDGEIQFNDGLGNFTSDSNLYFNETTNTLQVSGTVNTSIINTNTNQTNRLSFKDPGSAFNISFSAPSSAEQNFNQTLPINTGSSDEALFTDRDGIMDWVSLNTNTPAGIDTQIQYDISNAFVATSDFTWSDTNGVTIDNKIVQTSTISPTQLGSIGLNGGSSVYVFGSYAYVTTGSGNSLEIINVSDPTNPVVVSQIFGCDNSAGVFVAGEYAYVTNSSTGELKILNIDRASDVSTVSTLTGLTGASGLFIRGSEGFIIGTNAMYIVNIADPTNPSIISTFVTAEIVRKVYVYGNYAYVSGDNTYIIDISVLSSPTTSFVIPTSSDDVYVSGSILHISSSILSTQLTYDISNPASPSFIGATVASGDSLNISGTLAYLVDNSLNRFTIVDITDPSNLINVREIDVTGPNDIFVYGSIAYISTDTGLRIYDIKTTEMSSLTAGNILTNNLYLFGDGYFNGNVTANFSIISKPILVDQVTVGKNEVTIADYTVTPIIFNESSGILTITDASLTGGSVVSIQLFSSYVNVNSIALVNVISWSGTGNPVITVTGISLGILDISIFKLWYY